MVFGLLGHKQVSAIQPSQHQLQRNEYTSLKKIVNRTRTPSLENIQRNDQLDDNTRPTTEFPQNQQLTMSSQPLDAMFQKSNEEPFTLNSGKRLPIKVDVSVKIVPKH